MFDFFFVQWVLPLVGVVLVWFGAAFVLLTRHEILALIYRVREGWSI